MIRPLPTLPAAERPETLETYGCRVLRFVLAERVTATLSDRELELADHFYPIAVAAPDLSLPVLDQLAEAQRMIRCALRIRAAIDRVQAAEITAPAPIVVQDDGEDRGQLAPLLPRPIIRPPNGGAVPMYTKPKPEIAF